MTPLHPLTARVHHPLFTVMSPHLRRLEPPSHHPLRPPQHPQRTPDPPPHLLILLLLPPILTPRRPIILTHPMHRLPILQVPLVLPPRLLGKNLPVPAAALREGMFRPHPFRPEDESLRERARLTQEPPVPVTQAELEVPALEHVLRGHDVQHHGLAHARGEVDAQLVRDAGAAIMPADEESLAFVAEGVHECDHVAGHDGFGVGGVVVWVLVRIGQRVAVGFGGGAVAAEGGDDEGVMLREQGCHFVVHDMGLGEAMEEEKGRGRGG